MILRPLEEKGIFLRTQVLIRRDNPSKLVSEFVRAFIKRLELAGLFQPELPPFVGNGNRVDSRNLTLFPTSVAAV
jgi:hypothetical protein